MKLVGGLWLSLAIFIAACGPMALETATPESPTPDNYPPEKATLETAEAEEQQTARANFTPPQSLTLVPTQDTPAPDYSFVAHREAGAGIIISDAVNLFSGPWIIAIMNYWIGPNLRVFAGVTSDIQQGAVAILPEKQDVYNPELYLTPLKSGPVEIVDAVGMRLVVRPIYGGDDFYFDVPARQFIAGLDAPPLPTITPGPTPTRFPFVLP